MPLVAINPRKPAQAHAEIASICLAEAIYASEPRRTELLESARSHLRGLGRLLLTAQSPEEAWITYDKLIDLLELFDNPDQVPATSL